MINWTLSQEQAQYILNVLVTRPYSEVQTLIAELVKQAQGVNNEPPKE